MDNYGFNALNQGLMALGQSIHARSQANKQQQLLDQLMSAIGGSHQETSTTPATFEMGAKFPFIGLPVEQTRTVQNDFNSPQVQAPFLKMLADPSMAGTATNLLNYFKIQEAERQPDYATTGDTQAGFYAYNKKNPFQKPIQVVPGVGPKDTYDDRQMKNANGELLWTDIPGTGRKVAQMEKYNVRTGEAVPNSQFPGTGGSENQMSSQEGFYNNWEPDPASVMAVAQGKIPLNQAFPTISRAGVYGQGMKEKAIKAILRVNPSYEYYDAQNVGSMNKDYQPGGRVGQKGVQLNTAIQHSARIMEAARILGREGAPGFNNYANKFVGFFGGKDLTPLRRLEAAIGMYSGEMAALAKSGIASATEFDIQNLQNGLKSSDPASTIAEVSKEFTQLGLDKVAQLDRAYHQVKGSLFKNTGLLDEDNKKYVRGLGLQLDDIYGGSFPPQSKSDPMGIR